jgi:methionine synthase II (cobalamin-independent)
MRLSTDRILTTHMGSLPRVGRLADLLLARHDGREVDDREVAAEAETAMAEVVDRQVEAGVDVGNDGEMPRTAFMLYPQERMKGFGGQTTQRKVPLDVQRFPKWAASRKSLRRRPMDASITPAVVSELSYDDVSGVAAECAAFRRVLDARGGGFVETFMTAVSPGMVAVVYENKHYDSHEAYVRAIAREMKKEYDYIVGQGLILQIDAPTWRWSGSASSRTARRAPFSTTSRFTSTPSTRRSPTCRRNGSVSTPVGGTGTARTSTTSRAARCCRCSGTRGSAPCACRSPTPATRTRSTCCASIPFRIGWS